MEEDHVIALRCQSGDTDAFGQLYDRYIEKIYRFVYYKTFSKELAEDIVGDVFMKALQKIHSFDVCKGSFSSWLYRIAQNTVIDHYRTRKFSVPIEDVYDLGEDDRTEEQQDALRSLETIRKHLATLPSRQRDILILRLWEERSYREIAETVGGTEDSVKMMFSRSIRELREQFGPLAPIAIIVCAELGAVTFHV